MVPWQHPAEDHSVSSLRSPRKQLISYLEETNLTCLDAHDRRALIERIKEETDTREHQQAWEAITENVPGMQDYQVSDTITASNAKACLLNQEEKLIA